MPELGINLLSVRRLCRNGITGSLDDKHMYFRRRKKTTVKATMSDGLYWVTHVESDGEKAAIYSTAYCAFRDVIELCSGTAANFPI